MDAMAVGPLQSLAGAHPHDDITVRLEKVRIERRGGDAELRVGRPPVQSTGRWVGLVRLLSRDPSDPERFRVQHYDRPSRELRRPDRDGAPAPPAA